MEHDHELPSETVKDALVIGAQVLIPGGDESALLVIPRGEQVTLQSWASELHVDDPARKPTCEASVPTKNVKWGRLDTLHGILHFTHFVRHPGKKPPPIEVLGISLKKIQVFDGMSEETIAFTAELFLDGEHVGYVKNQGVGGANTYAPATPRAVEGIRKTHDRAAESGCPFEPLDSIINICILGGHSLKELTP